MAQNNYYRIRTRRDIAPGYRIVYKNVPSDKNPEELIIIAVGKREGLKVYKDAFARTKEKT